MLQNCASLENRDLVSSEKSDEKSFSVNNILFKRVITACTADLTFRLNRSW